MSKKQIIIVQSGWVFMGNVTPTDKGYQCTDLQCIRQWGTTRGLGEIALNGPTKETVLDPYGGGFFPTHAVLGLIDYAAN
jgi:hypothetical protein